MVHHLRPPHHDELAAVSALVLDAEIADEVPERTTLEGLLEDLSVPYFDLRYDARVVEGSDGSLIGWIWVWNPQAGPNEDRCYLFGAVHPARRRQGVGRCLLKWGIDRARERHRDRSSSVEHTIRTRCFDFQESARRLYEHAGMQEVRWFEDLMRPLVEPAHLPEPTGVRIDPWPESRDAELLEVRNAGFADHWGSTPVDAGTWHSMVRGVNSRPDLSFIATDIETEAAVGICLNEAYPQECVAAGRQEAWIGTLATLGSHRRRGIASSLIARSLDCFTDAGFTHALIGVDAESLTGAARLYRSLGFEVTMRSITWQLPS